MERKFNTTPKLHIKTNDTVIVLSGNDKTKKGKVLSIDIKNRKAIVEGVNIVTKHMKPSATNTEGGIKTMEAPIHISNLMLVEPKTGEPTKIGRKEDEKGKLQRYSKKTDNFIS